MNVVKWTPSGPSVHGHRRYGPVVAVGLGSERESDAPLLEPSLSLLARRETPLATTSILGGVRLINGTVEQGVSQLLAAATYNQQRQGYQGSTEQMSGTRHEDTNREWAGYSY